jgi:hypothetical protein
MWIKKILKKIRDFFPLSLCYLSRNKQKKKTNSKQPFLFSIKPVLSLSPGRPSLDGFPAESRRKISLSRRNPFLAKKSLWTESLCAGSHRKYCFSRQIGPETLSPDLAFSLSLSLSLSRRRYF